MSWSCSTVIPKGSSESEARAILHEAQPMGNDDCPEERKAAVTQAREAALTLIFSGEFGDYTQCGFCVSLNGHCNPENKPRSGWSNDCVGINITQSIEV